MYLFEGSSVRIHMLQLTEHLYFDPLILQIVEHELGTRRSLDKYTTTNPDLDFWPRFTGLDICMLLHEVAEIAHDIEFVGVGILAILLSLPYLTASNLMILLQNIVKLSMTTGLPILTFDVSSTSSSGFFF